MGWHGPIGKCGCCGDVSSSSSPSSSSPSSSSSSSTSISIDCEYCLDSGGTPRLILGGPFTSAIAKLVVSGYPASVSFSQLTGLDRLRTVTVSGLSGLNGTYLLDLPLQPSGCIESLLSDSTIGSWQTITTQLDSFSPVTQEQRHTLNSEGNLGLISSLPRIAVSSNFQNLNPALPSDVSYRYLNGTCPYWSVVPTFTPNVSHSPEGENMLQLCRDYNGTRGALVTRTVNQLVRQSDPSLSAVDLFTAVFTYSLELS